MTNGDDRPEWVVLGSSGEAPLGDHRWTLMQLLELSGDGLGELSIHTVERKSDGQRALALMTDPDRLDFLPPEIRAALETDGHQRIPLALIAGAPQDFFAEWQDLGQLPTE